MRFFRIASRFSLFSLLLVLIATGVPLVQAQTDACTSDPWSETVSYSRGDLVYWVYHGWKAKRNTTGVEPGTHKPTWQDLGACAGDPPTPPPPPPQYDPTPMQIFGVWHAGNNYADWSLKRDTAPEHEFDEANHWIIDRGDGQPSVNLVVLSFLNPLEVLYMEPDDPTTGVPLGMTQEVVQYFTAAGIRVMMSIGGITYTDDWDAALAIDATRLGENAATIAAYFGVGIEIDYEHNVGADLEGLQDFVDAYRDAHPYNASEEASPAARLTIDLAAGDRWLQEITRYATENWLDNAHPVLDYANAMVARASGTPDQWQEHVDGKPQYDPPIPPLAPNRFTGGLYLKGNLANCDDFYASEQFAYGDYVQKVTPNGAGTTSGMLGFMFWAAEYPSARKNYVGTVPPNTCEDGMGEAIAVFEVPVPMPALRQE